MNNINIKMEFLYIYNQLKTLQRQIYKFIKQLSSSKKMQEVEQQYVIEEQNKIHVENKDFNNHFPAVQIASKHYSLDADIVTGWKPKVRILGPIPLNFDFKIVDQIIDQLTSFGRKYKQRVIYLGHRFQSSFKMHQQIKRQYQFKYEGVVNSNYLHMAAYFRKFHSNFKSKTTRIFKGMNPTISKTQELIFDSNFEGGNLDASIKISDNQYDLFMRADSNTRGHTQWFYFSIKNCGKKKIKLNIVNFKKAKTMYSRGMKPYVFSSFLNQTNQNGWQQAGQNVKFQRKKLNYPFLEDYFTEQQISFNCLSFQWEFNTDWQEVQFAYAPPFTYSDNNEMIRGLRLMNRNLMKQNHCIDNYLKQQILCQSLSGLQVPLLTITDPTIEQKKKRCVVLSGRIHPGQPCGSYMMKGFLNFVMSDKQQAKYLRQHLVFKVIPMINPDGVTIGNFRTSLCGKDLNRTFKMNNDLLIPEVKGLKQLVVKLKQDWKNRMLMFFDFHGHSIKKNVFLYGPEYQIWEAGYYKTRIFPKLLSDSTQMFRYYSCLFRIAEFKRTTARAVILRNIPHCYTIEASTGFYYSQQQKKDLPFTTQKYEYMGQKIARTLKDYIDLLYDEQQTRLQRKQKMSELRILKSNRAKSKKDNERQGNNKTKLQPRKTQNSSLTTKEQDDQQKRKQPFSYMSQKARQMIQKIKRDEQQQKVKKLEEQGHQSDKFSQGGSDSQSESDDLNEQQLNKLHQDIIQSMKQFRQKIGVKDLKNNRQFSFKQQTKKKNIKQPAKPKVQVIASLRSKVQKLEQAKIKQIKQLTLKPIRQDVRLQKIKRGSVIGDNKKQFKELKDCFVAKPSIKSSIARLQQLQIVSQNLDHKFVQEIKQNNRSRASLSKHPPVSSMAKSRLYSLIQKQNYNAQEDYPLQICNKMDPNLMYELELINNTAQFQDKMLIANQYSKTHQNRWASQVQSTQPSNSSLASIKYVSQLQGRSLTGKLKKLNQNGSINNLIQSTNFVTTSAVIQKTGIQNIKFDSTQLKG